MKKSSIKMMSLAASRLLVALCTLVAFSSIQVTSTGVFQLRMGPFQNDLGLTTDGHCCSPIEHDNPILLGRPPCSVPCRTFFVVCLRHYQTNIADDSSSCTYGMTTTDVWNSSASEFHQEMDFGFDFTWPGAFTLVLEAYHDVTGRGPHQGSSRVLVSRFKMQRFLDAAERWRHEDIVNEIGGVDVIALSSLPRQHQQHRLHLAYRVTCDETFYGPGCDRLCVPRDDMFGHYDCDVITGERVCRDGWNGTYCETAVCSRGCEGVCDEPYECRCRSGWSGALCNECVVYPGCEHGSCRLPWQCNCDDGWGGLFCNQDLNYCTTHHPCENGGTCVHTGTPPVSTGSDEYRCFCLPGFAGARCEQIEPTAVNGTEDCHQPTMSCLNGGICVQRYDNALADLVKLSPYSCRCLPDFFGTRCELPTNITIANKSSDGCSGRSCRNEADVSGQSEPESIASSNPDIHLKLSASTTPSSSRWQTDSLLPPVKSPTMPAVEDVDDPGSDIRWIFLSVALGAGLALVTSSAVLVGIACCRQLQRERRSKRRASLSIHDNVRNEVTAAAAVCGRTSHRFDVEKKSTKMNNVIGASSKIAIIDVASKSACGDGSVHGGLGNAVFGFASSDTNLLGECVEVKAANVGRRCPANRHHIGIDDSRVRKTEIAPINGGFNEPHHQQVRYAYVDDRWLQCRVADSVPQSPLLILERIQPLSSLHHQRRMVTENFEVPPALGLSTVVNGGENAGDDEKKRDELVEYRRVTPIARTRPANVKQSRSITCETAYLV